LSILVFRDRRLEGPWPTGTGFQNVDEATTLDWIIKRCFREKGKVQFHVWSHGLPGFVQCGKGKFTHPTAGPGITVHDLSSFKALAGKVSDFEFHCCLVARIGKSSECNGHVGYDGNAFCFRLAQVTRARVKASLHIQWGSGNTDCGWAGTVFTWNAQGHIVDRTDYPLEPGFCASY
jgi:hypothetical protein